MHTGGDSSRSVGEALCNYVAKVKPAALLMMKVRVLRAAALSDKVQCRDTLSICRQQTYAAVYIKA